MASIREQIAQAFVTALAGTTSVGTRIFRSLEDAISREESPALVVRTLGDAPDRIDISFVYSKLTIAVDVFARGTSVETVIDPVAVSAYGKIMASAGIRALVLDIEPGQQNFETASADLDAGILTMQFTVLYRHSYGALDV